MELCRTGLRKGPLPVATGYLQRQESDSIRDLFRVQHLCRDFEVLYYLADAQSQLMHVQEARKLDTQSLKTGSQSEQVSILAEENSTQFGGPSQQYFVIKSRCTVFARSQNITTLNARAPGYGTLYVMIHVQSRLNVLLAANGASAGWVNRPIHGVAFHIRARFLLSLRRKTSCYQDNRKSPTESGLWKEMDAVVGSLPHCCPSRYSPWRSAGP